MSLLIMITIFLSHALLFTTTLAIFDQCGSTKSSSDLPILHIYGKCSPFDPPKPFSWFDTVLHMASKDPERLTYLSNLIAQKKPKPVPIGPGQQTLNIGNYVVRAQIGTPAQTMFMVFDTSNDAAWVPCLGCTGCSSTLFAPDTSSTYRSMDCSVPQCTEVHGLSCPTTGVGSCLFNQSYGGDSSFTATLSRDSLALASEVVPNYSFGCINTVFGKSIPPQGLLGLGRGPMSLVSQSGDLYKGVFSYCLPTFKSYYFSGSLKLGPIGQPKTIHTTPLLRNPRRPSLYYANLTGVSVGRVLVPIPANLIGFDPNTGAGTIIDSGTVITRFVQPAYEAIRDEFRNQVKGPISSLGAFDTCYTATNDDVAPKVTFHFEGLELVLPMENTLIHSSSGSLACLAMAGMPNNVNSVLNVIANLQQQNLRVLFDTANSRLGIARELCN